MITLRGQIHPTFVARCKFLQWWKLRGDGPDQAIQRSCNALLDLGLLAFVYTPDPESSVEPKLVLATATLADTDALTTSVM